MLHRQAGADSFTILECLPEVDDEYDDDDDKSVCIPD